MGNPVQDPCRNWVGYRPLKARHCSFMSLLPSIFVYSQITVQPLPPVKLKSEPRFPPILSPKFYSPRPLLHVCYWKGVPKKRRKKKFSLQLYDPPPLAASCTVQSIPRCTQQRAPLDWSSHLQRTIFTRIYHDSGLITMVLNDLQWMQDRHLFINSSVWMLLWTSVWLHMGFKQ